jgi:hypothetical protein
MWFLDSDVLRWLVDASLGVTLFMLVKRMGGLGSRGRERLLATIREQMCQWEMSSREFVEQAGYVMEELRELATALERVDIRASDTLRRLESFQQKWRPMGDRYLKAARWLNEGVGLEEVSRRTQIGLDELRLIRGLSRKRGSAAG